MHDIAALDELLEALRHAVQGQRRPTARLTKSNRKATLFYQQKNRAAREGVGLTGERLLWTRKIRKRKDRRKTTHLKDQRERRERDERKKGSNP